MPYLAVTHEMRHGRRSAVCESNTKLCLGLTHAIAAAHCPHKDIDVVGYRCDCLRQAPNGAWVCVTSAKTPAMTAFGRPIWLLLIRCAHGVGRAPHIVSPRLHPRARGRERRPTRWNRPIV